MALQITADQQVGLSITIVDAYGNAASVDGDPAWSSSDENTVTVVADTGGLSATASAVGPTGTNTQINVTADADLGAGVVSISGSMYIDVVSGQAATISIASGTPENKP